MMEQRNERTTEVRQEACASVEDQLGEEGDGKAAVSSAAPELPQLREALCLPSTFSCPFLPPAPLPWWSGLTLLLKSPFLRNFCGSRLPIPQVPMVRSRGVVPACSVTVFVGAVQSLDVPRKHNKN